MGVSNAALWAVMVGVWGGTFYAAVRIDLRVKAAKKAGIKEVGTFTVRF
jgi:hypothetical protein